MPLDIRDNREIFFKTPKSQGGGECVNNMAYVHSHCNKIYFASHSCK